MREDSLVAVLLINLDGFKWINDTFGHADGDDVLKLMSQRITNALRESDTVGRLISDEFMVILRGLNSPHDAEFAANNLLKSVTQPIKLRAGRPS